MSLSVLEGWPVGLSTQLGEVGRAARFERDASHASCAVSGSGQQRRRVELRARELT